MRRGFRTVGLVGFIAICLAGRAFGQGSDAALKDRVSQLAGRLGSEKAEERDAAEKALNDLGPRVLPLLVDADKTGSDDRKARVAKVRAALLEAQTKVNLGASKVTIQGKGIRLTEAIKKLQGDTGNTINDIREQQGTDVTNPALDLDIVDKPFFEALDIVAEKAGLTLEFATGDGSIGLMSGMPEGSTPAMPRAKPMVVYNGPFRVVFKSLGSVRDFSTGTGSMTAQFEVAWEPRLRPMLLAVKADQFQVVTDDDRPVPPTVTEESGDVPLRPENPAVEMNINLMSPDRISRELKSIKIKADVTVPAGVKMFKFKNIEDKDVVVKDGDISVKLESTTVEEQVWKVAISAEYPGGGPAFESYRQGLFNNRIWLQKADGSRFEHNGGLNDNGGGGGKLGFEYLFVDVPGKLSDYGLVYETPSKVIAIPLEFEFKKVPLP
jgi:hypothetical protein